MAQAYGSLFARIYNARWARFAETVAPQLLDFYRSLPRGSHHENVLDLCCGTGQLARHFLQEGYQVTGLDLSTPMLQHAAENCRTFVEQGRAVFHQGDAARFSLAQTFGLVVSTFDALNHLADFEALQGCFASVEAVLAGDGLFIFDLNTRRGLQRWNGVNVQENEEMFILNRGVFVEEADRAYTNITGFVRQEDGSYHRFQEVTFNTAFDMAEVRETLLASGWRSVYCARVEALASPLPDPEAEGRVFFVARR